MSKLVIENAVINSLLLNNAITDRFPFLKEAAKRKDTNNYSSGCIPCNKKPIDNNPIRASIAMMGEQDKQDFKRILNTDSVKVIYLVGNTTVETSF